MLKNTEYSKNNKYALFGFIMHKGSSLHRGHYFSIVKRDKKWYLCNDNIVNELDSYSENGYIFFDNIDKKYSNKNGYLFFYRNIYS